MDTVLLVYGQTLSALASFGLSGTVATDRFTDLLLSLIIVTIVIAVLSMDDGAGDG